MSEIKWRFKGNGFTQDAGLDTSDMETFKKDAMASLAREICQNSVDAKNTSSSGPVRVEFCPFEIRRDEIPWIEVLTNQIDACIDTWKNNPKELKALQAMKARITEEKITCLRISDFNTTGLYGLKDEDSPWHYLIHGTGLSSKSGSSGGSKGIGKYATFVASAFNTVFYETKTVKGEQGYIGISKLSSARIEGSKEKTQGIGYYASSEMNEPIEGDLSIDKNFKRTDGEYGTDIYIIGFKASKGWEIDIVSKVLDSFMSAIVYDTLEIKVADIEVTSSTLNSIVENKVYNPKNEKSIYSQYKLLTDKEHRFEDTIDFGELGKAKLYTIEHNVDDEKYATKDCVLIRYPYMKIKSTKQLTALPCSAMCIIEDNDLNRIFREIENPQHTDWEFKRIDDTAYRNEVLSLYKQLVDEIQKNIANHLATSSSMETDVEGAEEYIPETQPDDQKKDGNTKRKKILDKPQIQRKKPKNKEYSSNVSLESEESDEVAPDIGNQTNDDSDDAVTTSGNNSGGGGQHHVGDDLTGATTTENGNMIFKKVDLKGITYSFMCINKAAKKYAVVFSSPETLEKAYFELNALDESGARESVKIWACTKNGNSVVVQNNTTVELSLTMGEKVKLELLTDQSELFSGEVKLYAYR